MIYEEQLLYTQEDIDEWMRTCEELQENLREKRADIKELEQENKELKEQFEITKKALKLACRSLQFDFDYDTADEAENHNNELYNNFIERAKEE